MPLARAPMPFVTVAQEKRDFKIFVILITAWSRVQVLAGPYKKDTCSGVFFALEQKKRIFLQKTLAKKKFLW